LDGPNQLGESSSAGPSSSTPFSGTHNNNNSGEDDDGKKNAAKEPVVDEETKERRRKEREEVVRQLGENGFEYLEIYLPADAREESVVKESAVRDIFEKKCITPQKVSGISFSVLWFLFEPFSFLSFMPGLRSCKFFVGFY
jgi:hypothetical protein